METKSMKKNLFSIDYNNSSEPCKPCALECKKINEKINGRELSNLEEKEINEILNLFKNSD